MIEKIKVLYIDDEVTNLDLFEMMFEEELQVSCAASALEGLEILKNDPSIEVVITDWNMPSINGIEFVMKARENFPDKSYLMLSGYSMNLEAKRALDDGIIKSYMQKPFNPDIIIRDIKKSVGLE